MDYFVPAFDFAFKWNCNMYSFIFVGRCTTVAPSAVPQPRRLFAHSIRQVFGDCPEAVKSHL